MLTYFERFAEYGTMVEVKDAFIVPDGRAFVESAGGRRFKVHVNLNSLKLSLCKMIYSWNYSVLSFKEKRPGKVMEL